MIRTTETRNRDLLRTIFTRDPIGAIYMIGDLEDSAFAHCRWWTAADRAVMLLYSGLAVPIVLPFGDPDLLDAMSREIDIPDSFYTKLDRAQREALSSWSLDDALDLYVMGLDAPCPPKPVPGLSFELIGDAAPIAALYDDYPGNYFDPSQVPHAFYAAARLDGAVVAAAGTHAYAPGEGAAAIGNVVTAKWCRGRGIAAALLHFLCKEMRARGVRHAGLHVERSNEAAIRCYQRIGFSIHSEITQFAAVRKVDHKGRRL
jgi:ribosomal protein S18 acetylase RimI-like enzyme